MSEPGTGERPAQTPEQEAADLAEEIAKTPEVEQPPFPESPPKKN
jgi:hypothetical protein